MISKTNKKVSSAKISPKNKLNIVKATQKTLSIYSQTFKELARYDRGEKVAKG